MSDFLQVMDDEVRGNCYDSLDDSHAEKAHFVRDDTGVWYVQTSTDHGAYTSQIWFRATGDIADELDMLIEVARQKGRD